MACLTSTDRSCCAAYNAWFAANVPPQFKLNADPLNLPVWNGDNNVRLQSSSEAVPSADEGLAIVPCCCQDPDVCCQGPDGKEEPSKCPPTPFMYT